MITLEELYIKWCRETKRSGGVLLGSSVREFFEWLRINNYKITKDAF